MSVRNCKDLYRDSKEMDLLAVLRKLSDNRWNLCFRDRVRSRTPQHSSGNSKGSWLEHNALEQDRIIREHGSMNDKNVVKFVSLFFVISRVSVVFTSWKKLLNEVVRRDSNNSGDHLQKPETMLAFMKHRRVPKSELNY